MSEAEARELIEGLNDEEILELLEYVKRIKRERK